VGSEELGSESTFKEWGGRALRAKNQKVDSDPNSYSPPACSATHQTDKERRTGAKLAPSEITTRLKGLLGLVLANYESSRRNRLAMFQSARISAMYL
jgi:hypothetical protein